MRTHGLLSILIAIGLLGLLGPLARAQTAAHQSALSIIEAGLAADGKTPRYTVEANGADIRDLLAALLRKTGEEFTINQDVTGPISLVLRDKTLEEILAHVRSTARPRLLVTRGKITTVSTAPPSQAPMAETLGNSRVQQQAATQALRTNNAVPFQNQSLVYNMPVTLSIPDDRPIALQAALRQIETQTRVPIRLDPRVRSDIGLAAQFSQTPLAVVLDTISRTGALKWQAMADGSLLIAPTDWLLVSMRGMPAYGAPGEPCAKCGRPRLPAWRFCPYDGEPASAAKARPVRPGIRK